MEVKKNTDLGKWEWKIQDEPGTSFCARKKGSTQKQKGGVVPKGHRSQPKRAPNGQRWNN